MNDGKSSVVGVSKNSFFRSFLCFLPRLPRIHYLYYYCTVRSKLKNCANSRNEVSYLGYIMISLLKKYILYRYFD